MRRLLVAKVLEHTDVERGHHVMVLVDQVMAMEHVHPVPGRVLGQHLHLLVGAQQHNVLERGLLVLEHRAAAVEALHDLEVDEVDMDRMGPTTAAVLQLPKLDFAALGFSENPVGGVGEGYVVNGPLAPIVVLALSAQERWVEETYPDLPNLKVRSTVVLAGGRPRLARVLGTAPLLVVSETVLPTTKRMTRLVPA